MGLPGWPDPQVFTLSLRSFNAGRWVPCGILSPAEKSILIRAAILAQYPDVFSTLIL